MSDSSIVKRNIVRHLPVALTDEQILFSARSAAKQRRALARIREENTEAATKAKARIAELESCIDRLDACVAEGAEERNVVCFERFHAGVIELVREDLNEVIDTRPATSQELQLVMPGAEPGSGGILEEAGRRQDAEEDDGEDEDDGDAVDLEDEVMGDKASDDDEPADVTADDKPKGRRGKSKKH